MAFIKSNFADVLDSQFQKIWNEHYKLEDPLVLKIREIRTAKLKRTSKPNRHTTK